MPHKYEGPKYRVLLVLKWVVHHAEGLKPCNLSSVSSSAYSLVFDGQNDWNSRNGGIVQGVSMCSNQLTAQDDSDDINWYIVQRILIYCNCLTAQSDSDESNWYIVQGVSTCSNQLTAQGDSDDIDWHILQSDLNESKQIAVQAIQITVTVLLCRQTEMIITSIPMTVTSTYHETIQMSVAGLFYW